MLSIVIMSCDSYSDLWQPFFILYNKYFPNKHQTHLISENKECEYCNTIKQQGKWTKRLREGLKQIDSEYILLLLEDFFIQNKVDTERIQYCLDNFNDNIATFNFEKTYSIEDKETDLKDFKQRNKNGRYKLSCQAGIWDRNKLIELLRDDLDPWEWEESKPNKEYEFYINSGDFVIDYGYENHEWFGIRKGKWTLKAIELMKKEKIDIDFTKRGIYEKE